MRGCGMYKKISQPLQNETYSDVSKFHCQERGGGGGNVMKQKHQLTFHRNTVDETPHC